MVIATAWAGAWGAYLLFLVFHARARRLATNHALGPRVGTDNTLHHGAEAILLLRREMLAQAHSFKQQQRFRRKDVLRAFFLKILRQSLASHPIAARRASNVSSWCGAQA